MDTFMLQSIPSGEGAEKGLHTILYHTNYHVRQFGGY